MDIELKQRTVGLSEVLVVGLPFPAQQAIDGYELLEDEGRQTIEFSHPLQCLEHLHENEGKNVFAILMDLGTLAKEDYRSLQVLRSDKRFRHIPVIGIAPGWDTVKRPDLLSKGLDDIYQEPVSWHQLSQRLSFLHAFKPLKEQAYVEALTEFKLPMWKRAMDIVIASLGLIALSPLFLLIALAIKLTDKGPVYFKQKRAGTGYKVFEFIKFRSMYMDADKKVDELKKQNTYGDNAVFVKVKNDPRVTPIGRLIRKTSVDELPQLINVLKGEMSIVGNRPLPLYEAKELTRDAWAARFNAPAGITGLWQVAPQGKENLTMEERIALDIEYSQRMSFWTDLVILWKTPRALLQKGE